MIDVRQCEDRVQLLKVLPSGVWAEIGVASGSFSKLIMECANPSQLVLVDCWACDSDAPLEQKANMEYGLACVRAIFSQESRVSIVQDWSVPAAGRFPDAYFDVVYIDADHLRAYDDAVAWWPKVKSGGYLAGHDYIDPDRWSSEGFITVKRDIDRFAAERRLVVTATNERYGSWVIHKH